MVLKELKTKAIEQFVKMFNTEKHRNSITVNDVCHADVFSLTLDGDFICINRQITGYGIITVGCLMIDDLRTMFYVTNELNIVSLDNIEL